MPSARRTRGFGGGPAPAPALVARSPPDRLARPPRRRRSVPPQEQVVPPRLVALVREVRREQRVDVAARLERRTMKSEAHLLEEVAALAMVARLAGRDEVLPGVAAAAMARDDVVEGQVVRLAAAVLAGVPIAGEDLAARQLDARSGPANLVLEPDDRRGAEFRPRRPDRLVIELDHFC